MSGTSAIRTPTGRRWPPPEATAAPAARESAESRLRVSPGASGPQGTRVSMRLGPWLAGPGGEPTVGALGVLADDAIGLEIYGRRPPNTHAVTAELSVDVVAQPPWAAPGLVADARLHGRDATGGVAGCEIRDGAGRLVALATGRFRWVEIPPPVTARGSAPPPARLAPGAHHSLLDALGLAGVGPTRHGELGRLVLPGGSVFGGLADTVHGGVLLCLSDLVTDALAEPGRPERTTGIRVHYLRPAELSQATTATALTVHRGRSAVLYRVTTAGPSDRPCTIATVTRERAAH
ncbi:PaaI family thioesterase [Frankia sp. AgB32]|uniref:PaaI family thioesterase n=1 Tax=Frankia sp. AgB32 TaxID=631119 RepID=UPI00200CEE11|nr:PaaI family thioesterase [Frankia sp. AgB32]MCK9894412.1 PaaI family thioesterase [Frankia sp. AgB32]